MCWLEFAILSPTSVAVDIRGAVASRHGRFRDSDRCGDGGFAQRATALKDPIIRASPTGGVVLVGGVLF